MLDKLKDIVFHPEKYEIFGETYICLRKLYVGLDANPFLPIPRYQYVKQYLSKMIEAGVISNELAQTILKEF